MTQLQRKTITAIATGAILLNALTPLAFADTTIEISGNGSSSNNTANVSQASNTTVVQTNTAVVTNNVSSSATTGHNDANDNTGGDVTVKTGNANNTVNVSTAVNVNKADVNNCNCEGNTTVNISGNGSYSDNNASLNQTSNVGVFQNNDAFISNYVDADAKTGGNDANRNTGGDVSVTTGNATTNVSVDNRANANIARIGGGSNGGGSNLDIRIVGNGSSSDNDVRLRDRRSVEVLQDNLAYITNYVDADAKTGWNDANDNTGGDVSIDTGDAKAIVDVDNMANFNAADVDCGCDMDVLAKIAGNGTDSDNRLAADLGSSLGIFQGGRENGNFFDVLNYADADAKTGGNDADRNTGSPEGGDPSVTTGDATTNTSVDNSGNINVVGPLGHMELPSGLHFDFHFDLSDLLSMLHMS